jgi:hypothetical protein
MLPATVVTDSIGETRMKASIVKRLEALEKAVVQTTVPRLTIVDVHALPDADREGFWNGNTGILDRYAPPVADLPPGIITTMVVSLCPESRDEWRQTRGMTDAEQAANHARRIAEEDRREREAGWARLAAVPGGVNEQRPRAVWGYDRAGKPIYDDDPRLNFPVSEN